MTDTKKDTEPKPDPAESAVGDPETAGETTAADTITGPADTTPVGADTIAKVAYKPDENDHG